MPFWNGEERSLKSLAREFGFPPMTLSWRLNKLGWSLERALTTPCTRTKLDTPSRQSRAYQAWCSAKKRCYSKTHPAYARYGGRGIRIADVWKDDPAQFIRDMGEPGPGQSLERKDNDGPYSAENCKCADHKEQNNNRRTNVLVSAHGKTQTSAQWCNETGVDKGTLSWRLRQGWNPEEAIIPADYRQIRDAPVTAFGKTQTAAQWCEETGIDKATLSRRLHRGMDPEKAVIPPRKRKSQA